MIGETVIICAGLGMCTVLLLLSQTSKFNTASPESKSLVLITPESCRGNTDRLSIFGGHLCWGRIQPLE